MAGQESQRATGRQSRATDLLSYAFTQVEEAAIRGEKNQVGLALYNLAQNHPNPNLWQINRIERRAVISQSTGMVDYRDAVPMGAAEENQTIRVKVGGEAVRVSLTNERLARQLKNLDLEQGNSLMRMLGGFIRTLSALNTSLNPAFIITNAIRDVLAAMVNIRRHGVRGLGLATLRDYPKALRASMGGVRGKADFEWQRHFRDFAAAGGKVSFFRLDDVQRQRTNLERELRRMAQSKVDPRKIWRTFFREVDPINQAVDNAVRLSAFVNAKRAGMSPREAASLAKNLTVNFNRRGEWGRQLNTLYLFFNAGVQGTAVIFGAMKSRAVRRTALGIVAAGALSDLLNSWLSPDEEDGSSTYDDGITEFEKSRNAILMLPGGSYIRLPLPYGYNSLFNLGRNISAYARGAQSAEDATADVVATTVDAFNPIGGSGNLSSWEGWASLISPTISDPVVDLATNTDFAGRSIFPNRNFGNEHAPSSQLYFSNVGPVSRAIAEQLNSLTGGNAFKAGAVDVSPEALDHLFGFFTGAAGGFVQRAFVDFPARVINGDEILPQDIPLLRVVHRRPSPWVSQSDFYDRRDMIEAANYEFTNLRNSGDQEGARRAFEENRAVLALRPMAQQTSQALGELRSAQEAIENNASLSDGARQDRLDRIDQTRQRLLNQFNSRWLQDIVLPEQNF